MEIGDVVIETKGFYAGSEFTVVGDWQGNSERWGTKPLISPVPKPSVTSRVTVSQIKSRDKYGVIDWVFAQLVAAGSGGLTADEAVEILEKADADQKPKVNTVAPALTGFKQAGIVELSGVRNTRNGKTAKAVRLTPKAYVAFETRYGRRPY
jgi:hypothetical protein